MNERSLTREVPQYCSKKQWAMALAVVTLAFFLGGILVVIPRNFSAHAAGATITLVPKKANYKQQSGIVVKGSGFATNENVKIYWNYTGPATGTFEITATADGTGAFTTKFPTPLIFTGTYTIAAIGQTSGSIATAPFTLLPQIYSSPQAGGPGGKLFIYGNAFANGEQVNIYWDYTGPSTGTLIATVNADTVTGSFSTKGTIPANTTASPGNVPIVGIGQTSGQSGSYIFILYQPTLTLGPLVGSAQTVVTVTGYGFQENEKVNVYWNIGTTPMITVNTDSNVYGYMPPSTFIVPPGTTPGSYPVKAVGVTSNITITNTFTVPTPTSSLSVSAGPVGTNTTVSAQGYAIGETVNVIWNYAGPGTGKTLATTTAGSSGQVNTSFNVPITNTGQHTLAVLGATSGDLVKNVFKVQTGLTSNPVVTPPGTSLTIVGTGYQANESVKIYLDSTSGTLLATVTADSSGNISKAVTVPTAATPGSHNLVGVGQTSSTSFTGTVSLDTGWGDFGFDDAHTRDNPYENTLNLTNVSGLTQKWSMTTPTGMQDSPVYGNGLAYIATSNGILNAYHATSGGLKWSFNSNSSFPNFSAPLVDPVNNLVFFGTIGYEDTGIPSPFFALNAQNGRLVWSMIIPWNDFGFPSLHFGTIYVGNSHEASNGSLYAIDELTGRLDWSYATSGGVWGAVSADVSSYTDNDRWVFTSVGNPSNSVVALDATTGTAKWTYSIPNSNGDDDPGSAISVTNGLVYVDSKIGSVYAIHESNGTLAWQRATGTPNIGNVSSLAIANGVAYVGSLDTNLYALNATTGAVLWKSPTGKGIQSSPAYANGVVYFASLDGNLYAVDAATGAIKAKLPLGANSFSSPTVVNGWIYCTATNGKVFGFSL